MKNRKEKIKAFLNDKDKLKVLLNDEEFIKKVSEGEADAETYREELEKFGLEISTDEAEKIKDTVNKIFETPTEKIKLGDDFLKDIAGGTGPIGDQSISDGSVPAVPSSSSSSQGLSFGMQLGLGIGIPVAAWLASGIGCAIAASVYRKKGNKDKFHKCATAAFHVLNAPLIPVEAGFVIMFGMAQGNAQMHGFSTGGSGPSNDELERLFTHPVEEIFGVDVK